MRTADKLGLLLGRMIDLLRRMPGRTEDHKATLRGLMEIVEKRSVSVRLGTTGVSVEGVDVDRDTPFVALLMTQMQAHGLAEVRLAHGATPLDMMHLIRGFALDLVDYGAGYSVEARLRDVGASSVSVVTHTADQTSQSKRQMRITEALAAAGVGSIPESTGTPEAGAPAAPPPAPAKPAAPAKPPANVELVSAHTGKAYDELMTQLLASSSTLTDAISNLKTDIPGPTLLKQLDTVQGSVTKALDNDRVDQAIDAVTALIHKEAQAKQEDSRRAYGVAIRRLLSDQNLTRFCTYLLDELYAADVTLCVKRAGQPGTKVVLDLLVKAPTFAERKAYLGVLRQMDGGTEPITRMLNHHEWFVIRNMADLAGELQLEEAVPALGRALTHTDPRARKAVGIALARIGTEATVPFVSRLLTDQDASVRADICKYVGGKGHSALAMPIVAALDSEEAPEMRAEYLRALGRIGTNDAVGALKNVATRKSGFLARKASTDQLAAVEGLALANSPASRSVLETLKNDGGRDVREAAQKALRGTLG